MLSGYLTRMFGHVGVEITALFPVVMINVNDAIPLRCNTWLMIIIMVVVGY